MRQRQAPVQRSTMQGSKWSPAYSGHTTITPTFMQPTSVGQNPQKRRRTDSVPINGNGLNVGPQHPQQFIQHEMSHTQMDAQHNITQVPPQPAHVPKRGARACTACRKGKNRCEGEVRDHQLRGCQQSDPLTVPPRPGPSLHVVDAKSTAHPAFLKSQRRKMFRLAQPLASSKSFRSWSESPMLIVGQ